MQIDVKIRDRICDVVERIIEISSTDIQIALGVMRTARTAEEFMEAKRDLLIAWIQFPYGRHVCYFCEIDPGSCDVCEWGKLHRRCGDPDSNYMVILNRKSALFEALDNIYHDGEEYGV